MKHLYNLAAIVVISIATTAHAQEVTAPVGLTWGMTQAQAKSKGVKFEKCYEGEFATATICTTNNPLKPVSFSNVYLPVFIPGKGLQKLIIIGKDITGDIQGSEGKELYASIKAILTKKYGQPESEGEHFGLKLYDEYDEFYQCMAYAGCGAWVAFWMPSGGGYAGVQLKGISRGKGYVEVTYESKEWSGIIDANNQRKAAKDDDAL